MKVGIVAGEKSGDYLGCELIAAIRARYPKAEFVGLAGPLMMEQGAKSLAEMDKISIFGLEGLFSSLREILAIRKKLYRYFVDWQPDVFIGIDVPDFNLGLERKLKEQGIPVVHYVSPTVWAWRGGRIKKIRRAIDLMLVMFPFEERYYQQHDTPVKYVGHALAQKIDQWSVPESFKNDVAMDNKKIIAVLPGSRMSEVSRLAEPMITAALELAQTFPDIKFVIPAASAKITEYLLERFEFDTDVIQIIDGHSRDVLATCELAILASGTAALEAALFAKPMVVMYKVSWLSAFVFGRTITVEHYSMPNHLTEPPAVVELIQGQATKGNLVIEVSRLLTDKLYFKQMGDALAQITPRLTRNSSALACDAIEALIAGRAV